MRETTVDPELFARVADRATGHYRDTGGLVTPIPEDWPFRDTYETVGPAGSIRSSILDFARWAALQLGRGTLDGTTLLSAKAVDAMHAPRTYIPTSGAPGAPRATAYALGWMHQEHLAGTVVWHNGGTTGQHSIVALYELPNVALVVLTNTGTNFVPERMRDELLELLLAPPGAPAAVRERAPLVVDRPACAPVRPAPLAPVPPLPLERYVGTYENPAYGRVTVELKTGALVMSGGPRPLVGALATWSGNTFVWKAPLGLPPEDTWVTFTVPSGGAATQLVATACREVRGGLFTRTAP